MKRIIFSLLIIFLISGTIYAEESSIHKMSLDDILEEHTEKYYSERQEFIEGSKGRLIPGKRSYKW